MALQNFERILQVYNEDGQMPPQADRAIFPNKHIATGISREGDLVSVWKVGSYGRPEVHVVRSHLDKPGAAVLHRSRNSVTERNENLTITGMHEQEIIKVDREDKHNIRVMIGSTVLEPMTQEGMVIMPDFEAASTPGRALAEI